MILTNILPPLDYLNECFTLDETCPSGLRWKERPQSHFPTRKGWASCRGRDASKTAGSLWSGPFGKEYYSVRIAGKIYGSHRIVYSIYHNECIAPDTEIDHEDGNGLNNKPLTLRKATRNNNCQNTKIPKSNTSGHKGVFWNNRRSLWFGLVGINGKRHFTGYSPSKEVIIEMVRELRESLHKEFTNHGK